MAQFVTEFLYLDFELCKGQNKDSIPLLFNFTTFSKKVMKLAKFHF